MITDKMLKLSQPTHQKTANGTWKVDNPYIAHHTFTDFEDLCCNTRAWNLEFSKLDSAPFHAELFQLISPDLVLARGRFNGQLKQLGQSPQGFRTFTIPAFPDFWMYWRGREVDGNNLMAFPLNGELDTVSDPRFDVFTISTFEETLFTLAEQLGFQGLEKRLKSEEVFRCDPIKMNRLRRCLQQCEEESRDHMPNAESVKNRLLVRLIEALGTAKGDTVSKPASARRLKAICETDRFILTYPDEMPSIKELCKLTQVSERTLEYAFREYYGMKPKAYINAMRLNAARRELRSTRTIADAANTFGFWHMGQFARDYRRLFGELPSDTLVRSA